MRFGFWVEWLGVWGLGVSGLGLVGLWRLGPGHSLN